MAKIDIALYDLGGVLVSVSLGEMKSRMARLTGLTETKIDQAIFQSGLKEAFDRGIIGEEEFTNRIAAGLDHRLDVDRIRHLWAHIFSPISANVESMERLRAEVTLMAASNTDPIHLGYITANYGWASWFERIFPSFRLGALKPEPEFYERMIKALGVSPERCLFIDDKEANVEAALRSGLKALHADSPDSVTKGLIEHGLLRPEA